MKKLRKFFNYATLVFMLLVTIFICIGLLVALNSNISLPFPFLTKANDFIGFPHYLTEWFRVTTKEQNMTLNIPLKYIPPKTSMNIHVLKASIPDKTNTELFGIAGLQGVWDQQSSQIAAINTKLNQEMPTSDFTGLMERSFAMAALSGVHWVSLDFSWVDAPVLTAAGGKRQFDWTLLDRVFDTAKRYNINLIPVVAYSPPYARQTASAYDRRCLPSDITASGSAMYNEFVAAAVSRYRTQGGTYSGTSGTYGISNWIIWNEPNSDSMKDCDKVFNDNAAAYASLFKGAYLTIHGIDPENKSNLKVVMAGLVTPSTVSSDPKEPSVFLSQIYKNLENTQGPDILNMHYFNDSTNAGRGESTDGLRTALDAFINIRDKAGSSAPVWITAIGRDYDKSDPGISTRFMDNAFDMIKRDYANGTKKVEKVLWFSGEGRLYRVSPTEFIENTPEETKAMVDYDFSPRETYFRFAEHWLQGFSRVGHLTGIPSDNDMITVSLSSKELPDMNYEYALLAEAPNQKAVLQLPYIVSLQSVVPPNCRNLTGPTTVRLGESGSYSANFISRQQNLIGQIFYDSGDKVVNNLGKQNLPGSEATYSVNWTPATAGTYSICCSAWNGDFGHCMPGGYDYGTSTCAGPDTCLKVVVPPRTPTNMKRPEGTVAGISMVYVEKWQKFLQTLWVRTGGGLAAYTQKIPKTNDGAPDWDAAEPWIINSTDTMLNVFDEAMTDAANMLRVSSYTGGDRYRLGAVKVDGTVTWGELSPLHPYPGPGAAQSITGETFTNPKDGSKTYFQAVWMNDKEYYRSGPIDPQTHLPVLPSAWNGPISINGLPPNDTAGSIQAHDITLLPDPDNVVLERIVRANIIYWRMVPLNGDGMPDWGSASGWMLH